MEKGQATGRCNGRSRFTCTFLIADFAKVLFDSRRSLTCHSINTRLAATKSLVGWRNSIKSTKLLTSSTQLTALAQYRGSAITLTQRLVSVGGRPLGRFENHSRPATRRLGCLGGAVQHVQRPIVALCREVNRKERSDRGRRFSGNVDGGREIWTQPAR